MNNLCSSRESRTFAKFKIIVDTVSCGGDASNHCFTTRGSFRYYGLAMRDCKRIFVCGMRVCVGYTHNYVCLRNWHTIPRREICMYFTQPGVHFPLQSRACSMSNFASNYRGYLNTSHSLDSYTITDIASLRGNIKAKVSEYIALTLQRLAAWKRHDPLSFASAVHRHQFTEIIF